MELGGERKTNIQASRAYSYKIDFPASINFYVESLISIAG